MPQARADRVGLGIVTIVASVFLVAMQDAVVKKVVAGLSLWQIYVLRSLIALPLLAGRIVLRQRWPALTLRRLGWPLFRGLLMVASYLSYYAALPFISLPVMAAAYYTAPLFITLLSAALLGEPVGRRRWLAIAIGFAGVLVILRPGTDAFAWATLLPVAAAIFFALAVILTRTRCLGESAFVLSATQNACYLLLGLAASAAIALLPATETQAAYPFLLGHWTATGVAEWGIVALLALLMVASSSGMAMAYQSGPPTIIATFDYSYLAFAAFFGFVFFAERPDAATLAGMLLIAGAGLVVMRRAAAG